MSLESIDQDFPIPDAYCSVRKCRRADLASKGTLQPAKFVLHILGLLAKVPLLLPGPTLLIVYPMHKVLPRILSVTMGKLGGSKQSSSMRRT